MSRNKERRMSAIFGETLKFEETQYVILLIDRSQSMLWPYLEDMDNQFEDESLDYSNAVEKVKAEISLAHAKTLQALRSSRKCKDGNVLVYQYLFNYKEQMINPPEPLSYFGEKHDKVAVLGIDHDYEPSGPTALYDVLLKSLDVIEEDYLKKARENEHRIDKVILGVITDGEDNFSGVVEKDGDYNVDESKRNNIIADIKKRMHALRDRFHLSCSILIGLTSDEFTSTKLDEVRNELLFDEAISLSQSDEKAIRRAFKLVSDTASG